MLDTAQGQRQALDYLQRILTTSECKAVKRQLRAENKRLADGTSKPHGEYARHLVGDVYLTESGLACSKYSKSLHDAAKTSVTPKHANLRNDVSEKATPEQVLLYATGSLAQDDRPILLNSRAYAAKKRAGNITLQTVIWGSSPIWLPCVGLGMVCKKIFRGRW